MRLRQRIGPKPYTVYDHGVGGDADDPPQHSRYSWRGIGCQRKRISVFIEKKTVCCFLCRSWRTSPARGVSSRISEHILITMDLGEKVKPSRPSVPRGTPVEESTRWGTTLSSKANLHHAIDFRAFCVANLVTCPADSRGNETFELHRVWRSSLQIRFGLVPHGAALAACLEWNGLSKKTV